MELTLFVKKLVVLYIVFGSTLCDHRSSNDGGIQFPEEPINGEETTLEARSNLIRRLSQIDDMATFLRELEIPKTLIGNRFGNEERSNAEIFKPAVCMPELQPVCIINSTSDILYHPACVRVKRCGGCCGDSIYSCQPITNTTRNVKVVGYAIRSIVIPGRSPQLRQTLVSNDIVVVEEHTKCACSCTRKAEDCTEKQNYHQNTCSCVCKNVDEKTKCLRNNATYVWNEATCTCSCRGSYQCTTGYHYDHATCSCKDNKVGSRFGGADESWKNSQKYDTDSIYSGKRLTPVYTVSEDDPRRRQRDDPE